jgi:protocatechuate 3,4-dioxygenase beta subunit
VVKVNLGFLAMAALSTAIWGAVASGEDKPVQSAAQADAIYSGTVYFPDGRPAADATVKLYYCHDASGYGSRWLAETKSDDQGAFRLPRPDFEAPCVALQQPIAKCFLIGTLPGFAPAICDVLPRVNDEYSLVLEEGHPVTCRVVDAEGLPVRDARVGVASMAMPRMTLPVAGAGPLTRRVEGQIYRELYSGITDDKGEIIFAGVPASLSFFSALHPDHGIGSAPTQNDLAAIRLNLHAVTLRGTVTDKATGKPVEGAVVAPGFPLTAASQDIFYAVTDEKGAYRLTIAPVFTMATQVTPTGRTMTTVRVGGKPIPGGPATTAGLTAIDAGREPACAPGSAEVTIEEKPEIVANITLEKGTLVSGKVTDAATGQPLSGAWLSIRMANANARTSPLYRISDEHGRYVCRLPAGEATLTASAPAGLMLTSRMARQTLTVGGDEAAGVDISMDVALEGAAALALTEADGRPAFRATTPGRTGVAADPRGVLRMGGFRAGVESRVYALSDDRSSAGVAVFTPPGDGAPARVSVKLAPAREGEIQVTDMDGKPLPASVSVMLTDERGRASGMVSTELSRDRGPMRITGLLPGTDYIVIARLTAQAPGLRQPIINTLGQPVGPLVAGPGHNVPWRFPDEERKPKLTIQLPAQGEDGAVAPVRTTDDFAAEVAALGKDAAWTREDPVRKDLTWIGGANGLAIADATRREVKRYGELLGEGGIIPTAIAFAPEKVWLGTNKGLFAYDRAGQFWTQFAVGAEFPDVTVTRLDFSPQGVLSVTAQETGKTDRQFEYDTTTRKWTRK